MTSQIAELRSELREHSQDMAEIAVGLVQERQRIIEISGRTIGELQKSQKSYQETLESLNRQQGALLTERLGVLTRAVDVVQAGQQQMQKTLEQMQQFSARVEVKASEMQIAAQNMAGVYRKETLMPVWLSFALGTAIAFLCQFVWMKFMAGAR